MGLSGDQLSPRKCRFAQLAFFTLLAVASFAVYYHQVVYNPRELLSDFAYMVLSGKDMFSGNPLLQGWYTTTNRFFLLSFVYGFLGTIFGYTHSLIFIASAFYWAAFSTALSYIILRMNYNRPNLEKGLKLLLFQAIMLSSSFFSVYHDYFTGGHADAVVVSFLFIWNISINLEQGRKTPLWTALLSLLFGLALLSDTLAVVFGWAPICLVLGIHLFFEWSDSAKRRRIIQYLLLTVFLLITPLLLYRLLDSADLTLKLPYSLGGITVTAVADVIDRALFYVESLLFCFGADVFGRALSGSLAIFLRAGIFFILLVYTIYQLRSDVFKEWKRSLFNQVLFAVITLNFCVLSFSTYQATGAGELNWSARLTVYSFVSLSLLLLQAKWLDQTESGKSGCFCIAALSCCVVLLLGLGVKNVSHYDRAAFENSKFQAVTKTLEEQNRTHGYGTYWLSTPIDLTSEGAVSVRSIRPGAKSLAIFEWACSTLPRWDYADFFLIDDSNWWDITKDQVYQYIGYPSEEIQVENISILLYDKNIMPYIENSGYEGRVLKDDWDFAPGQSKREILPHEGLFYSDLPANEDGSFTSTGPGMLFWGPYRTLDAGIYQVTIHYSVGSDLVDIQSLGWVDVCSEIGAVQHAAAEISPNESNVTLPVFTLENETSDIELRCYAEVPGLCVERIVLERLE